jgi:peptidylprolyl isomerase
MAQAKNGDTVKVHYTGKVDDGAVFESTLNHDPVQFVIGQEERIPGFEQALVGMSPGDRKTTRVPADEAHGPHNKELLVVVNRNEFPADLKPETGQWIKVSQPDGSNLILTVIDVCESSVTLDANHPLAGKDLTFDIQLIEIL